MYAIDPNEGEKHQIAKKIIEKGLSGSQTISMSNQTLAECINVLLHKYEKPPKRSDLNEFMSTLLRAPEIKLLSYSCNTAIHAGSEEYDGIHFWDAVIAQTMKENGITHIYTENTKDFEKIKGIKAVNPFKH